MTAVANQLRQNLGIDEVRFESLPEAHSIPEGIAAYHRAEDVVLRDMPATPLFFGRVRAAHSPRVRGVVVDAFERINAADIHVTGG